MKIKTNYWQRQIEKSKQRSTSPVVVKNTPEVKKRLKTLTHERANTNALYKGIRKEGCCIIVKEEKYVLIVSNKQILLESKFWPQAVEEAASIVSKEVRI